MHNEPAIDFSMTSRGRSAAQYDARRNDSTRSMSRRAGSLLSSKSPNVAENGCVMCGLSAPVGVVKESVATGKESGAVWVWVLPSGLVFVLLPAGDELAPVRLRFEVVVEDVIAGRGWPARLD